jgi:hypothetical protein
LFAVRLVGRSVLSTSTVIEEACSWFAVVVPHAVSIYFPGLVPCGIKMENEAGAEVAIELFGSGCSPITKTCLKAVLLGDDTLTEIVCPGATTLPSEGNVI